MTFAQRAQRTRKIKFVTSNVKDSELRANYSRSQLKKKLKD